MIRVYGIDWCGHLISVGSIPLNRDTIALMSGSSRGLILDLPPLCQYRDLFGKLCGSFIPLQRSDASFGRQCIMPLAIMATLFRRRSAPSPMCPLCKSHEETIEHLFLLCPWVEPVWFGGLLNYRVNRNQITTWVNWITALINSFRNSKADLERMLSYVAFTCWQIWKARCSFLFQQHPIIPRQVLAAIPTNFCAF